MSSSSLVTHVGYFKNDDLTTDELEYDDDFIARMVVPVSNYAPIQEVIDIMYGQNVISSTLKMGTKKMSVHFLLFDVVCCYKKAPSEYPLTG